VLQMRIEEIFGRVHLEVGVAGTSEFNVRSSVES
jgi:hypothetical protein